MLLIPQADVVQHEHELKQTTCQYPSNLSAYLFPAHLFQAIGIAGGELSLDHFEEGGFAETVEYEFDFFLASFTTNVPQQSQTLLLQIVRGIVDVTNINV